MREIELRLLRENPRYRTIWVQYSNHRQLRVVITLFPHDGPYRMIFGDVNDLSYESINYVLETNLRINLLMIN